MAEIIQTPEGYEIELTISNQFIEKYQIHDVVQQFSDIYFIDYKVEGTFKFPYRFPPFNKSYDKPFLTQFLENLISLLKSWNIAPERHLDHLLFLSSSYTYNQWERTKENNLQSQINKNGKLLVKLMRSPLPEITKINILDHVENDEYVLAYLAVVSKKGENYFKTNEQLDLSLIDDETWEKLVTQISIDNNIKVTVGKRKNLLFSRALQIELNSSVAKSKEKPIKPATAAQNTQLVVSILNMLIEEQKQNNTALYQLISRKYFDVKKDAKELTHCTYGDQFESHNDVLRRIALLICSYLQDEKLMLKPRKGKISSEQKDFLYPFFLLLRLMLKDSKLIPYGSTAEMNEAIEKYKQKLLQKPDFGSSYLQYAFKNIKRI